MAIENLTLNSQGVHALRLPKHSTSGACKAVDLAYPFGSSVIQVPYSQGRGSRGGSPTDHTRLQSVGRCREWCSRGRSGGCEELFCSLELPCASIALVPDKSELTKLRIGLAVIELCLHPLQIFRQSEPRIVTAVTREAILQESQSYRFAFLQDRRLRPPGSDFLNERFRDFSTDAAEQYRLTCDNHTLALDLPDLDDHPICLHLICGGNLNISRNVLQPNNTEARICNDASEFFFASEFA